jgi:hypothetical protein
MIVSGRIDEAVKALACLRKGGHIEGAKKEGDHFGDFQRNRSEGGSNRGRREEKKIYPGCIL